MKQKPPSHFGRLEFDPEQAGASGAPSIQTGRWLPYRKSLPKMPLDFCIPLQIIRVEGQRSIYPGNLADFMESAFYGGTRLLAARNGLNREKRQNYRLMNLLFRWSLSPRRTHARAIERLQDLVLTKRDKRLLGEDSLLPIDLTVTRSGKLRRITPKELVACGRAFATDEGIGEISFSRALEFGLLSRALNSPATAKIRAQDSESFLRFALFGRDVGKKLEDQALVQLVEENLITLLDGHLEDESEQFGNWWDDLSGLCRALSRRASMKAVRPDQVRYVLYDLLLRSHRYAARCIEIQMRDVFHLVHPRLTVAELPNSKPWYERTKWLSQSSPIVFHSRVTLLVSVLSLLAESPDREILWPACLQALLWKTQIILARRDLEERRQSATGTAFQITDEHWRVHEEKSSIEDSNLSEDDADD